MDDHRIGRSLYVLRHRKGLTQAEVAKRSGLSQSAISLAERGHVDRLTIRSVRRLFAVVDAGFAGNVLWRGGALDRLLDSRHARLIEHVARLLTAWGWNVAIELSYAVGRESGSIDLVAFRPVARAAAMFEIKSDITSVEELGRRTDAKERLLPGIVERRWGERPITVARIVVVEDRSAVRDRIAKHRATFDAMFPARTVRVRRWLREPRGRLAGVWFLRTNDPSDHS